MGYWHGGAPGLSVGDVILPPSTTGTPHILCAYMGDEGERPGWRRDRVYVTTRREVAVVFAALFLGGGAVYLVHPSKPLEPDPDSPDLNTSQACLAARVLSVHTLDEHEVLSVLASMMGGAA